jgi:hypothetical protein
MDSARRELSIGERAVRWIESRIAEVLHCIGRRRGGTEIQIAEHRHLSRHNGACIFVIGMNHESDFSGLRRLGE